MNKLYLLPLLLISLTVPGQATITPAPMDRLGNGVILVQRVDRTAPRVGYSLLLRAGAADETAETAGWRRLAVNAMLRSLPANYSGAEGKSGSDALRRLAEAKGGEIGATVGPDFVEFYATGESGDGLELLKLTVALLRTAPLLDADIDAARDRLLEQVTSESTDTAARTEAALRGKLYVDARGELAAYGLPESGTETSLRGLTNDKVRELVMRRLRPARLFVGAVGDVDGVGVRAFLEGIPATHSLVPAAPFFAPSKSKQPSLVVREFATPMAWVFVSYALLDSPPADNAALRVLVTALGDSSKARLPASLLNKGLVEDANAALSVAAQFSPRRYASEITMFAQTGPQGVERAKNSMLDEVRKLREGPLTPAELQSAKNFLRGSWSVERQELRQRAFLAVLSPSLGGPADTSWVNQVQAVTAADVQRVAKKYLNNYAVALVMPQS